MDGIELKVFDTEAWGGYTPSLPDDITFSSDESALYTVFPGFCDVHVHLREPGFLYKEDIRTGTMAAAHGGYTDVCCMPNLDPVPDSDAHMAELEKCIKDSAVINVHPYASVTAGEQGRVISDMEVLAGRCIAFSDDGRGVADAGIMREAMRRARELNKIIAAHCEVAELASGGSINECAFAEKYGIKGIGAESEWRMIERDIGLAHETGCSYHVCHVSCVQSVALIREAKKSGIDITCETAPHYLLLDDSMLEDDGRYKMNPPLRSRRDREALLEGVADGTVDMIATDHAPHSAEEKSRGLVGSAFGITGLETAFSVLYTGLVRKGLISLSDIIKCITERPRRRFGIEYDGSFTLWNLEKTQMVDSGGFLSKGRSTPFDGTEQYGVCAMTVCRGKTVYKEERKSTVIGGF